MASWSHAIALYVLVLQGCGQGLVSAQLFGRGPKDGADGSESDTVAAERLGYPLATAVYRPFGTSSQMTVRISADGSSAREMSVEGCPFEVEDDDMLMSVLDNVASSCMDMTQAQFCDQCLTNIQFALVAAFQNSFSEDDSEDGTSDTEATLDLVDSATGGAGGACGQAVLDYLEEKGVDMKKFKAELEFCDVEGDISAEEKCPWAGNKKAEQELEELVNACAQVFSDAENEGDFKAGRYCRDCYWALLTMLARNGGLGDQFWCVFRTVRDSDLDETLADTIVFDALYEDEGFLACSNYQISSFLEEEGEINPFTDEAASTETLARCWSDELKPDPDSVLGAQMKDKIESLDCSKYDAIISELEQAIENAA